MTSARRGGSSGVVNYRSGQRRNVLKVSLDDFLRTKNALNAILMMNRDNNMNLNTSAASIDLPELEERARHPTLRGSKRAASSGVVSSGPSTGSGPRKVPLERLARASREISTAQTDPSSAVDEKIRMIDTLSFALQTGHSNIFDVQRWGGSPGKNASPQSKHGAIFSEAFELGQLHGNFPHFPSYQG